MSDFKNDSGLGEKIKLDIQYQFFIGNERYKIKDGHSMGVFAVDDNGAEWMVFIVNNDIVGMLTDYQELRSKWFQILRNVEIVDQCMFALVSWLNR